MIVFITISVLLIGFLMLTLGAKVLCDAAIQLSSLFKINSALAGVFLVSIGTAAPDCMSALIGIIEKQPDISIGNILGSNFTNLTLGLGIAGIIAPFKCDNTMSKVEMPLLALLTLFFVMCCWDGKLTRVEGCAFIASLLIYIFYSLCNNRQSQQSIDSSTICSCNKSWSIKKSTVLFIISAASLAFGAHFVVTSCCRIADWLGVSKTFIGFSLLAFGTSAPEIFVVTTAALRKQHTICSGNIIGSNLINLMCVAGLCSVIHPFNFDKTLFSTEALSLLFVTFLCYYIFKKRPTFSRLSGIIFVATYCITMFLVKK